jgi:hypothetical protein
VTGSSKGTPYPEPMTISQDSTHPTGVTDDSPRGSSGAQVARERKAYAALKLHKDGKDWDEIAEFLGYPTARAARVATELALKKEFDNEDSAAFLRRMASDKLEELLKSVYAKAKNPESPDHLLYLREARILIGQHVEMMGYAAPKKAIIASPTASQIEKWVAEVMQLQAPEVDEADIFDAEVVSDTDDDPEAPRALPS